MFLLIPVVYLYYTCVSESVIWSKILLYDQLVVSSTKPPAQHLLQTSGKLVLYTNLKFVQEQGQCGVQLNLIDQC